MNAYACVKHFVCQLRWGATVLICWGWVLARYDVLSVPSSTLPPGRQIYEFRTCCSTAQRPSQSGA